MAWRDSPARYGVVTRILHWGMAALLLWQITGMALRLVLGRTPLMAFWVGTHQSIGTVLLLLVVLRLVWAWIHRANRPSHAATWAGRAARLGHGVLYGLMLVIPSLALLRAIGNGRGYAFFGHQIVERGGARIGWMAAPADWLHGKLAWLLLALILGHVVMALVHHIIWRDGTLSRMAGSLGRNARKAGCKTR